MAYTSVVLARQKVEHLLHPSCYNISLPKSEIESIHYHLCSLQLLLVNFQALKGRKLWVGPFDSRIEDVVAKLEDLIEGLVSSYGFTSESTSENPKDKISDIAVFSQGLINVKQEINSINEMLKTTTFVQHGIEDDRNPGNRARILSRVVGHSGAGSKLVELETEQRSLRDWLGDGYEGLRVVPVVGMAGIGKTTLIQQVCDDSYVCRFKICLMVTLGPNCELREFLLVALDHLGVLPKMHEKFGDEELGKLLWKFLKGQSYLIVLDDVWSAQVWVELKQFFPDERTSSRIILTTRSKRVGRVAGPTSCYVKKFLRDEASWDLLREIVFHGTEESCSFQLEKFGKEIAKNCEGLPLAIVSVAQLLRDHAKTVDYWKEVSEDENPLKIGIDNNTLISKSLYPNYEMLPHGEKICFLYVGVFPKTYEVSCTNLIKLWAAEGFIESYRMLTVEDVGKFSIKSLNESGVVLSVDRSSTFNEIKSIRVHIVFRNLCIAEAQKENFCLVIKKFADNFLQDVDCVPRLCIHNNVMLGFKKVHSSMESLELVRTLLCFGPQHIYPLRISLCFRLLNVLDAIRIRFYDFPSQVLKLVRLRYLALTCDGELPKSISELWNLQIFILARHQIIKSSNAPVYLPMEIWNLKWLRHLYCPGRDLPIPSHDSKVLGNLLSLSGVSAHSCTSGVLSRVPNLKKLAITLELAVDESETFYFLGDVAKQLQRLESFKCAIFGFNSRSPHCIPNFTAQLMKLSLSGNGFSWESIIGIDMLPKLQVLKLHCNSFCGAMWEMRNGAFPELQMLLLEDLDIKDWKSEFIVMPNLRTLRIQHCYKLQRIPELLAFSTLVDIDLIECNSSLVVSARQVSAQALNARNDRVGGLNVTRFTSNNSWADDFNFIDVTTLLS